VGLRTERTDSRAHALATGKRLCVNGAGRKAVKTAHGLPLRFSDRGGMLGSERFGANAHRPALRYRRFVGDFWIVEMADQDIAPANTKNRTPAVFARPPRHPWIRVLSLSATPVLLVRRSVNVAQIRQRIVRAISVNVVDLSLWLNAMDVYPRKAMCEVRRTVDRDLVVTSRALSTGLPSRWRAAIHPHSPVKCSCLCVVVEQFAESVL